MDCFRLCKKRKRDKKNSKNVVLLTGGSKTIRVLRKQGGKGGVSGARQRGFINESVYSGQQCKDCPLNVCTSGNSFSDMPILRPNSSLSHLGTSCSGSLWSCYCHFFTTSQNCVYSSVSKEVKGFSSHAGTLLLFYRCDGAHVRSTEMHRQRGT